MSNTNTMEMEKTTEEKFVSRRALCARWGVSIDFLRALEAGGKLNPVKLSPRCLRYRQSEIERVEAGSA